MKNIRIKNQYYIVRLCIQKGSGCYSIDFSDPIQSFPNGIQSHQIYDKNMKMINILIP
jgi:hypothetical protein